MKPHMIYLTNPFPSDDSTIRASLQAAGYGVEKDDSEMLLRKMMLLLDHRLDRLREPFLLRLFQHAQVRKGRPYTSLELRSLAQATDDTPRFFDLLQTLTRTHAFLRGIRLECPYCEVTDWYLSPELPTWITCRNCGTAVQLPQQPAAVYRLNQIMIRGLNNGALTLLLTLYCLGWQEFTWGAGYRVKKNGQVVDLDLVLLRDEQLTLIECKDRLPQRETLVEQVTRLKTVAEAVGGELMLATLQADVPEMDLPITLLRQRDLLG